MKDIFLYGMKSRHGLKKYAADFCICEMGILILNFLIIGLFKIISGSTAGIEIGGVYEGSGAVIAFILTVIFQQNMFSFGTANSVTRKAFTIMSGAGVLIISLLDTILVQFVNLVTAVILDNLTDVEFMVLSQLAINVCENATKFEYFSYNFVLTIFIMLIANCAATLFLAIKNKWNTSVALCSAVILSILINWMFTNIGFLNDTLYTITVQLNNTEKENPYFGGYILFMLCASLILFAAAWLIIRRSACRNKS